MSPLSEKLNAFSETLALKDGINDLKSLFLKLQETLQQQNKEITLLKRQVESQDSTIKLLTENHNTEVKKLEDKIAVMSASVDHLKSQADNHEQYSRRYCLRIKGIENEENETSVDCVRKVTEVCESLNYTVEASDIDRAHRVGKDRKTMIVKFFSFAKRTNLYKARKNNEESGVKIHLDVTKSRLNLLDEADKLIVDTGPVDFVFADINCNTVAKMKNNRFKFFNNLDQFKKLL